MDAANHPPVETSEDVETSEEAQAEEEVLEEKKPTKDLLDRTWDFFASVPVATVLLFVIAAASVVGSLITQEGLYDSWLPPQDFYPQRYGPVWGNLLYKTGMTRMYTSWWYLTMLFMIGASLVVCSLERFVPLWKAVQRPNVSPDPAFVKHLKNRFTFRPEKGGQPLEKLAGILKAKRYGVVIEGDRLYADKGRWGRWGPYILHIGLILILVGGMMRAVPGFYFDQMVWVRDDATVKVPGTNWYVKNEKFTVEYYDNGAPKAYRTDATVIDGGKEVRSQTISMNEPLMYRWVELYQSSYKTGAGYATVALNDRASGQTLGEFKVDLTTPASEYKVGGHSIKVVDYFPDFGLDQAGKPVSKSSEVNNPGLKLEITDPAGKTHQLWYFVFYPEMEFNTNIPMKLETIDMAESSTTGLKVKKDLGVPVIYFGLLIVSLGSCLTFYLAHRRYWAIAEGSSVVVGGWTNRNQNSFKTEIATLATALDPKTNPQKDITEGEER